jgi:hypothetical protein
VAVTALSLDALRQMLDRRNHYKVVLGERLRRLEAATAVDTFVRIADRADDIGLRAARNLRRFGWLFQELGAIPPRPEHRRPE